MPRSCSSNFSSASLRCVEEVLAQFGKAGIDVDALAARLQEEGAASFVKSWNELLEVLASRRAALAKAG